ncbi:MAG: DUF1674 domain-containing protein [Beijerinckiaceae bacterium]
MAAAPSGDPAAADAGQWPPPGKVLTAAAQRALAEAEERRKARDAEAAARGPGPKEINGRDGPEPARYGDWEVKGIVSDF